MSSNPAVPLGLGSNPVSAVSPFTYSDNVTYLQKLESAIAAIDSLSNQVDNNNSALASLTTLIGKANNDNASYTNSAVNSIDLANKAAIAALRAELIGIVNAASQSGLVYDPTTGSDNVPVTAALERVYDYDRIFSFTAEEYDDKQDTAEAWDAHEWTARYADTWPTYVPGSTGSGSSGDGSGLTLGTTAGTAAAGNDPRLSDARTPRPHADTHAAGGVDPVTPEAIGAATYGQLVSYTAEQLGPVASALNNLITGSAS